ncbi:MAG TPA: hypothetical protein VK506_15355 [Conexibacter sp.]|nr:hypothetical protein [Conexibacter sp.]
MTWIRRGSPRIALALGLLAAALLASSAHAANWAEIPSNTGEDITAIEYQSADRFWFGTGAGRVFRRVGGVFQQEAFVPGAFIKDIEFQDGGGLVGFAVGTNGTVLRTADGGDNWVPIPGIRGGSPSAPNNCGVDLAIGDVDSVRFAGNARAWLLAGGSQVYRTRDGATTVTVGGLGNWEWINNNAGTCRISGDVDDAFPIPGTDAIYFVGKSFGQMFFSSNALTSTATLKSGSAGNGFEATRRLVGDPANANRMWSVAPNGGGGSYYGRTTDGWNSELNWTLANSELGDFARAESVDYNGGTVLAAGSAGMILNSINGSSFYLVPAGGAVATQDWTSVSLASANDAAVGGTSGKLLISLNAASVPLPVVPPVTPPVVPVTPPRTSTPRLPGVRFPSVVNPPVRGGVARVGRRFVSVPVSGRLTPPRGVSASAACRGKRISLRLSKTRGRRRTLLRTTVRVSRSCRYRKLLRVRRSRVAGARALLLQVSFRGNSVVGASRATYTLPVV